MQSNISLLSVEKVTNKLLTNQQSVENNEKNLKSSKLVKQDFHLFIDSI